MNSVANIEFISTKSIRAKYILGKFQRNLKYCKISKDARS